MHPAANPIVVSPDAVSIKVHPLNVQLCDGDVRMAYVFQWFVNNASLGGGGFAPVIITVPQLAERLGMRPAALRGVLEDLKADGILQRRQHGPENSSSWTINVNLIKVAAVA